jgi:Flp pilus assembly pilin Flp
MLRHGRSAERGQGMLEYILIAIVVGLIVIFARSRFGGGVSRRYDCSNKTLETAKVSASQSPFVQDVKNQQSWRHNRHHRRYHPNPSNRQNLPSSHHQPDDIPWSKWNAMDEKLVLQRP